MGHKRGCVNARLQKRDICVFKRDIEKEQDQWTDDFVTTSANVLNVKTDGGSGQTQVLLQ